MNRKYESNFCSLTPGHPDYPAMLREIRNYPKEIFYTGNIKILKEKCVAIVGSRKTTQYGKNIAYKLGKRLAKGGIVVVSGMAMGIDTYSHQGAIDGEGSTVAVMGCGIDLCYPTKNRNLKENIEKTGLILSEYPPGTEARNYFFPQRNRIISGLSQAVVVVQAGVRSGALITAEIAAEQGRDVYSVPGNIDSQYHLGSNKLIKDGVTPLINIEDLMMDLGVGGMEDDVIKNILGESEKEIYKILIKKGEMSTDEICMELKKTPAYINGIIAVMEMKGVIFSAAGKIFIANA